MRRRKRAGMVTMFVVVALAAILMVGIGSAIAGAPDVVGADNSLTGAFLCPAVGGPNWAERNVPLPSLPGGQTTFLPGHNQAGNHANSQAHNIVGPHDTNPDNGLAGPGQGNSDWSPIWPHG